MIINKKFKSLQTYTSDYHFYHMYISQSVVNWHLYGHSRYKWASICAHCKLLYVIHHVGHQLAQLMCHIC